MPNWCENVLHVSGNLEDLKRFKEFAKGENGYLDFNRFVPYPEKYRKMDEEYRSYMEEIEETRRMMEKETDREKRAVLAVKLQLLLNEAPETDGYNSGGYEWCCANWGTKWNAAGVVLVERPSCLVYYFDTAWSPPIPVVMRMSEMFPMLTFTLEYCEEGIGLEGMLKVRGGKILMHI